MDETQKQYELVTILSPQLEGVDLEKTKKEIEGIITGAGGSVNFKEEKKHNLAYPINKQGQGIYLISQVSIAAEKVADISKEFKLNKQVLRHLITRLPVVKPEVKKSLARKKRATPRGPVGTLRGPRGTGPKIEARPSPPEKPSEEGLEEIDKKLDEIIGKI